MFLFIPGTVHFITVMTSGLLWHFGSVIGHVFIIIPPVRIRHVPSSSVSEI